MYDRKETADFKTSFPTSNSVHASEGGGKFLLLRFLWARVLEKARCLSGRRWFLPRQGWDKPSSLYSESRPFWLLPRKNEEKTGETRGRQLVTSLVWFQAGSHLMWTIFSSVFNRLRLGCTKSSSESSVSSSFSLASEVSSASDLSGKLSPGKISRSFSSKYRLTVSPDTAISDPACQRRRGWEGKKGEERQCGKWEQRQAGGRNGLKQEEEKEKEDTNLELVNTRDGWAGPGSTLHQRYPAAPSHCGSMKHFYKFQQGWPCMLFQIWLRLPAFLAERVFFKKISNRHVCSIAFLITSIFRETYVLCLELSNGTLEEGKGAAQRTISFQIPSLSRICSGGQPNSKVTVRKSMFHCIYVSKTI